MWGRNQINLPEPDQSAFVPSAFSVASARRDERESRESRPGDETNIDVDTSRPRHVSQVVQLLIIIVCTLTE